MPLDPANYASISALIRGAEAHLRSAGLFNDLPDAKVGKYIGRQPAPGKPPGLAGQWYAAIYWAGGRGTDKSPQGHDVTHGITITLTARLNNAPKDRQGIRLTTPGELYDLVDVFAGPNVVHGSYELLAEANKLIPGTEEYLLANGGGEATVNGFIEPLVLDSFGPERVVGKDWVGGAQDLKDVYAIDIKFSEARRARLYEG